MKDRSPSRMRKRPTVCFERIVGTLPYFDLLENPLQVFGEVNRRYVPGLIDPICIVPFLRIHLGADRACAYARALLDTHAEPWPSFESSGRS